MNTFCYPARTNWDELLRRPVRDASSLNATVCSVLDDVCANGDVALRRYEEQFDHVLLDSLAVSEAEMQAAATLVSDELKTAIQQAHDNIYKFHEAQRFNGQRVDVCAGVQCWQKSIPIERVGLYIPGGTAPLFSTVLMLATPARIAGCTDIVLCTPPSRDGSVNPAILYAAQVAGVNRIFKLGGVQAIGAMAYGTETVPKVYKIFGPGNQYVMAAKQQVSLHDVAIDMPAGPSEVAVIADDTSHPDFVAADLLSQAEHGVDSQVLLFTTCADIIPKVEAEVERQLALLPRRDIAEQALLHSKIILLDNNAEVLEMTNMYAPEHLIIETDNCMQLAEGVVNAGSVFLGHLTPESAGDYASGTNHTLPTNGYAVAYNGVNLDSYCRKVTFQHITAEGVAAIGQTVATMATGEQLDAHARAMTIRMQHSHPIACSIKREGGQSVLQQFVRPNIWALKPYSSARDEYKGHAASVFLDANECPYNAPLNRYPDPLQTELKEQLSLMKAVPASNIFLGNGSDEAIDLVYRVFCRPGVDNVVAMSPTYGMYQVCADINDVEYRTVSLDVNFQLQPDAMLAACDANTRVMWICSPNNPTGNDVSHEAIERLLRVFPGIVVVDEAYSDFSSLSPFRLRLDEFPNLVVLNTFSKAWGSAAIRLGMAFASAEIVALMNKVKYPYNVNRLTQQAAIELLARRNEIDQWRTQVLTERTHVMAAFAELPVCERVFPTAANFFLAKVGDACRIYDYLVRQGIIVRNRHRVELCADCLRVTIGTPDENCALISAMRKYKP